MPVYRIQYTDPNNHETIIQPGAGYNAEDAIERFRESHHEIENPRVISIVTEDDDLPDVDE